MLSSAPPSTRVHAGGGISVHVNGAAVDSQKSVMDETAERLSGNIDSKSNAGNSSEWATTTITWRNGAQRISDGNTYLGNNNNTSSSVDINGPTPQLVHVIRVKPSDPGKEEMDSGSNVAPAVNKAKIRITSNPNGTYVNNNVGYCKGKISVMVGSPINQVIKGEDERSSSGASSAPGSDCERSDSDREADDGTDSGFCLSGKHCARVSVTANNTTNHSSIPPDSSTNESFGESTAKNNVIYNGNGNNVRLSISSYTDKDSENKNVYANRDNCNMQFHLRELDTYSMDKKSDSDDVQSKIASAHAMLSGQGKNDGAYNFKNKVRSSIVSLLVQSTSNRNYPQEERGRIVFYTTSVGVIRSTSERCRKVQKILETLMVRFDERDVFMNRTFQEELRQRLGTTNIVLPQIFVEGRHLGGAEVVEQLNEMGQLREILRPYKKYLIGGVCELCGGFKYLLCPECGGTKKSANRIQFSELVSLRCVSCDEGGLIRCSRCMGGEE